MPISETINKTNQPVLLDCTLRDGGYYNHWDFSSGLITDYLTAMAAISVDFVEIGFRSLDRLGFKGAAAYSTDAWIRGLPIPEGLKIGVMVNAAELISHSSGVIPALQKLFAIAEDSPVSLVRIACHLNELETVLPGCAWLSDQGYRVGLNLMQIADRSNLEIEEISNRCSGHLIDVLYFADSLGSMSPEQSASIIKSLRKYWSGALGIHTHDNMTQALANCLRAVEEGVTWVDCTVSGMGRGPGNVKTEYLAIAVQSIRPVPCNITPLLTLINKYFAPMQTQYGWGANPYYYLAGMYGIHPTYIQEMLSDTRYAESDILAVIDHFRAAGAKQFCANSLEAARHFYTGKPRGSWQPASVMAGREVLILGTGPGLVEHQAAIEEYIRSRRPFVIALNTQTGVDPLLIDVRAACHPIRLLADCSQHVRLPQPLITPASMLPESVVTALGRKQLLDFGLTIAENQFGFEPEHCILPTSLVIAYAIAVATSGKATHILLSGFDGYGADDPRTAEMDSMLNDYQKTPGALPIQSITPTRYKIPTTSVYAMISANG